jgi:hypothetical protein
MNNKIKWFRKKAINGITGIRLILGRIVLALTLLQFLSQIPLLQLFLCILPLSPALILFFCHLKK